METNTKPTSLLVKITEKANQEVQLEINLLDENGNPTKGSSHDIARFFAHFSNIIEGVYENESIEIT